MNEGEVTDYQKSAATGHRPTWSMGVNGTDAPGWEGVRNGKDPSGAAQDRLRY